MAVPNFQKAVYANEEGKACVEESAAADGTFEDSCGECASTRRRSWWTGIGGGSMPDEKSERTRTVWSEMSVPSLGVDAQGRSSRIFTATTGLFVGRSTLSL